MKTGQKNVQAPILTFDFIFATLSNMSVCLYVCPLAKKIK